MDNGTDGMSHRLPDIDIAIVGEPRGFLQQMADLGRASKRFTVEQHYDALGEAGFDAVNFRLTQGGVHRDLGFQLLSRPTTPGRVEVEVRAARWTPDPPTRTVYCEAARSLVVPLLAEFNRTNATRYRLRIERPKIDGFKITERTAVLLDRFAVLANTSSLHPLDWKRFYRLVHEGRQEIPEARLRSLLIQKGFSGETAHYLADLYTHLWAFKLLRW